MSPSERPASHAFAERGIAALVAIAFLARGLAYLFLLPPCEGFDETAHYSYISLLATTGTVPDFRTTPVDATLQRDTAKLPQPYSGVPPFDRSGLRTYHAFHHQLPPAERQAVADRFWTAPPKPTQYEPGDGPNWQGQHPPLYYLAMWPVYHSTRSFAPGWRLVALRLITAGIVAAGVGLWVLGLRALPAGSPRRMLLLAGVAVVWMPALDHDLFRLGNDALVSLLFTAATLTQYWIAASSPPRLRPFALLGLLIGLGLLTKLTFVPLAAWFVTYNLVLAICAPQGRRVDYVLPLITLVAVPVFVAGWWFALATARYGGPFMDAVSYSQIRAEHVDVPVGRAVAELAKHIGSYGATFAWAGSWSWVHRPYWNYLLAAPYVSLAAAGLMRYAMQVRRDPAGPVTILHLGAVGALVAGFTKLVIEKVLRYGYSIQWGGYYLFSIWPAVGVILAMAWRPSGAAWRVPLGICLGLVLYLDLSGYWFLAQVYSGDIVKSGSNPVGTAGLPFTPANLMAVIERNQLLSFPVISLCCLSAATLAKIILFVVLLRTQSLQQSGNDTRQ